jgi:WhiB family redox-sensing transcriptional regulator
MSQHESDWSQGRASPPPLRSDWRAYAACANALPDIFFGDLDSKVAKGQTDVAKAICATCHVRRECLATALRTNERNGIWGGLTPTERARLEAPAAVVRRRERSG